MSESLLLPYRLRTVRIGVQATFLVLAAIAAAPLLPMHAPIRTVPFLVIVVVAALGAAGIALLRWRELFARGSGMPLMYVWSVLDILLITALVAVSGGPRSPFFWLYTLTTFFMASSYPPRSQLALLGFTYACYLGLLTSAGAPIQAGDVLVRFAILGVLTFMASFLFGELTRQMQDRERARGESARRAAQLKAIAAASHAMNTLDSEAVLARVMDATVDLGYDAAMLGVFDPDGRTYLLTHGWGVPDDLLGKVHPVTGLPRRVLERGQTVHVDDYATDPRANASLLEAGLRCGVATPVRTPEGVAASLVVAGRQYRRFSHEEIEVIELLADHAGQALENARRFEREQGTVRRLAELDRLKRDFLSNVSHELRTPLTAISGMASTLMDHWERLGEERRTEFVGRVSANARALDEIITTLLDFSRLDSEQIVLRPEPVALSDHLERTVERLCSLFAEGAVHLEVEHDLVVVADPWTLERVVENLLSNAAKHTPRGTPVRVTGRSDGESALLTVADEGGGIPPEELPLIGSRFFRGGDPDTRKTRGTGLGLAVAREALELHGSSLEVQSSLGWGSTFSFRLPLTGRDDATPTLDAVHAGRDGRDQP